MVNSKIITHYNNELAKLTYTDTPKTIYIDGFQGVIIKDNIVKLGLFTEHFDPDSSEMKKFLEAYLTMSLNTLLGFHTAISTMVDDLKEKGLIAEAKE